MSDPSGYLPGQVVNGHVWTGSQWVPLQVPEQPKGPLSPWRLLAAVVAFTVAGVAALQGVYWLYGFLELDSDGNPFSGLLALLGMVALLVAAGFGIAGVVLLNRRP